MKGAIRMMMGGHAMALLAACIMAETRHRDLLGPNPNNATPRRKKGKARRIRAAAPSYGTVTPHQGKREIARRLARIQAGTLQVSA